MFEAEARKRRGMLRVDREPIIPTNKEFHPYLNPLVALHPNDCTQPAFDYTRFNVAYWQGFERLLVHTQQQDMGISVVFDRNDSPVHPDC
jgi:hypothetical protein